MRITIKTYIKNIALIFAIGIFSGFLLIYISEFLPTDVMKENVKESLHSLQNFSGDVIPGEISTHYNIFSDAGILLRSIYDDGDFTKLQKAVLAPFALNSEGENSPRDALIEYLNGQKLKTDRYARYWHGNFIIYKPLLLLFNYNEIRIIFFCIELALMLALALALGKRKLGEYYFSYFSLIAFMGTLAIFATIHFMACFCISMIASIVMLKRHDTFAIKGHYVYFFLIIGMATSYFDIISYPLVTWGIPLVFLLILEREMQLKEMLLKRLIIPSLSWIVGYFGFWACKWIFGSILIRENLLRTAFGAVIVRTSSSLGNVGLTFWDVVSKNMSVYNNRTYYFIGTIIVLFFIVSLIMRGKRKKASIAGGIAFLIVAVAPFCWYVVTKNHSYGHFWMTFRIISLTVFALTAFLTGLVETERTLTSESKRKRMIASAALTFSILFLFVIFINPPINKDNENSEQVQNPEFTLKLSNIVTNGKWAVCEYSGNSINLHPGDTPTTFDIEVPDGFETMSFTARSAYSKTSAEKNNFTEKFAEVNLSIYLDGNFYKEYYVTWLEEKDVEIPLKGISVIHFECDEGKYGLNSDATVIDNIKFE